MAMADSAHCADESCEPASTPQRPTGPRALRAKLLLLSVLALELAGCASNPPPRQSSLPQRQARATPVRLVSRAHLRSEVQQHSELRIRRPDPALLAPQPTPNCEFKRADIKAVDADEWARLKIEYERQCYQDAEKSARERLSQLQGSAICEIERTPQTTARALRSAHSRPGS